MKQAKARFEIVILIIVFMALVINGCAVSPASTLSQSENIKGHPLESEPDNKEALSKSVETSDLVEVNYTLRLSSGNIFFTTEKTIAEDTQQKKAEWFQEPNRFRPVAVLAGKDTELAEIAKDVIGMRLGGKKTVTLPPEQGFGQHDPKKVIVLPKIKTFPKLATVKPKDYVLKFNSFPVSGKHIDFTPYYKSKVVEVNEGYVILEAQTAGKKNFEADYGTTIVKTVEDDIHVVLEPRVGAPFALKEQTGRIVKADEETFTVDCNHPAAGEDILLEIEVVSIEKASQFAHISLQWIEDHNAGLATAQTNGKPVVLVLHAEWCGWCKKLLNNVMNDPRITSLNDRFVWVKINSDVELEYKDLYEQKGFPLIVLLTPEGEIIKKLDGFRDAAKLKRELDNII